MNFFTLIQLFFFKQKTANELRISDWNSDVCSSDLSGFAQVDFELTPTVTLTEGALYSYEKKALTISDTLSAPSFGPEAYNTTSNLVTWKVGANWKPTDQVMIYANVATGFKSPEIGRAHV